MKHSKGTENSAMVPASAATVQRKASANNLIQPHNKPFIQRKAAAHDPDAFDDEHVRLKPQTGKTAPFIQTKSNGEGIVNNAVSNKIEATRGGGDAMAEGTKSFMENRFGSDFSDVKIHTGDYAAQMSNDLNAQAFTVGKDIYFNSGKYAPGSSEGKHLLAHELTHTIQQGKTKRNDNGSTIDRQIQRVAYKDEAGAGGPGHPLPKFHPLTAGELSYRIARSIGVWETNRGHDEPNPQESKLDTVAGVHASMATIDQETMPNAITGLRKHKELWKKVTPAITKKELNDADTVCIQVVELLHKVASSKDTPADFIKKNGTLIKSTFLSEDDVSTMFDAVDLKNTIDAAHADIKSKKTKKEKKEALKKNMDAIDDDDRLGLGEGSLKAYIETPAKWGENRAAWQRKAVDNMPDNLGGRINSIAISDDGEGIALPVIADRVAKEWKKDPRPDTEDIITTVSTKNNPGEANYGENVLKTYNRLYP